MFAIAGEDGMPQMPTSLERLRVSGATARRSSDGLDTSWLDSLIATPLHTDSQSPAPSLRPSLVGLMPSGACHAACTWQPPA